MPVSAAHNVVEQKESTRHRLHMQSTSISHIPPHRTMSKGVLAWSSMTMQTVLASNVSGSVTREPALPGRRKSPPWWSLCSQAPYLCHITIFTHTNIIIQLLVGHKLIFVHTQYGWLWIWMFVDDCKFPRCQRQPNTILLVLLSRICHKHPNEIPAIPHVSLLTKWKPYQILG